MGLCILHKLTQNIGLLYFQIGESGRSLKEKSVVLNKAGNRINRKNVFTLVDVDSHTRPKNLGAAQN